MKANAIQEILGREFLYRKEIQALSTLLSGELSAIEAYNLAIEKVKDAELIPTLEQCRNSHALRIQHLRKRMEDHGKEPLRSSGWWGTFALAIEGGATMISDKVAMSVLAAGEDFGYEQYLDHMKDLDTESFELVEKELLPAQRQTLETMTLLCAYMRADAAHKKEEAQEQADKDKSEAESAQRKTG